MEQTLFTDSTGQERVLNLRFHRESRIRYRADSLEELVENNWELLKNFINHHKMRQVPRIQELMDYARERIMTFSSLADVKITKWLINEPCTTTAV